MAGIADFITVNITRQTTGVKRTGFGTPLILAETSAQYERVGTYTSLAGIVSVFGSSGDVYDKASAIYSQENNVKTLKVGRKQVSVNTVQVLTQDAFATAGTFTLTYNGVPTAAIAFDATAAAIETAFELVPGVTSVTVTGELDSSKTLTIEFDGADAETYFSAVTMDVSSLTSVSTSAQTYTSYGAAADASWTAALNAVIAFDNEWYGLCATTYTEADILELAAVIETQMKIYAAESADATVITSATDDVASDFQDNSYTRSGVFFNQLATHNNGAAMLGYALPLKAGSLTWAYKTLAGETVDTLSEPERAYALAKKANVYLGAGGKNVTQFGTTGNGGFFDTTRGIDWIEANIAEDVYQVLTDVDKIPYTDKGVGSIMGIVNNVLDKAVIQGIITNDFTVSAPLVADISTADKASRLLPDVAFRATLQGAIHTMTINGTVSV